jgi:hypothetical protein
LDKELEEHCDCLCDAALAPADPNLIVLDLESKSTYLSIYLGIAPPGIIPPLFDILTMALYTADISRDGYWKDTSMI